MSRILLFVAGIAALALPIGIGAYAIGGADQQAGLIGDDLDAVVIDRSLETVGAPIELLPVSPPDGLAQQAAADRAGAVALVRQALLDDPAMLSEAIEALDAMRARSDEELAGQIISQNAELLFSGEHASVLGNPQGSITLVEFLDYNCGFCKRAHGDVMALIEQNDDLRVLVKDFPVLGPGSLEAAQVAIAARGLGADMGAFIDIMMAEQDAPADAALARQTALLLGVDGDALDAALADPQIMQPIAVAYQLAEALDIRGTPAFIIGDERIMGAVGFDRLALALQAERARVAAR